MAIGPRAAVRAATPLVASTVDELGGAVTDPCPEQMNGSEPRMQDLESTGTSYYIGIDVSKTRLDIHIEPTGERLDVDNSKQGLRQLVHRLAKAVPKLIVFEATGKYHRHLHRALADAGLACAMINPRQARHFAKALGQLAKTDAIDARMLALYARHIAPQINAPASQAIEQLKELVSARRAAVAERTALSNRISETANRQLQQLLRSRHRQINREIDKIKHWINALIKADEGLTRRYQIIISMPGMGPVNAMTCLAEMSELGCCTAKQIAALAGVAPMARESGKWAGKRCIKGGRKAVRNGLHMAALSAARTDPNIKAFYKRLTMKGKLHKVALTAVMRKLIILANTLIRENREWQPIAP